MGGRHKQALRSRGRVLPAATCFCQSSLSVTGDGVRTLIVVIVARKGLASRGNAPIYSTPIAVRTSDPRADRDQSSANRLYRDQVSTSTSFHKSLSRSLRLRRTEGDLGALSPRTLIQRSRWQPERLPYIDA